MLFDITSLNSSNKDKLYLLGSSVHVPVYFYLKIKTEPASEIPMHMQSRTVSSVQVKCCDDKGEEESDKELLSCSYCTENLIYCFFISV
jgi:hypothetical protein